MARVRQKITVEPGRHTGGKDTLLAKTNGSAVRLMSLGAPIQVQDPFASSEVGIGETSTRGNHPCHMLTGSFAEVLADAHTISL